MTTRFYKGKQQKQGQRHGGGAALAAWSRPDLEFRNDLPQKIVGVEPPETDQNELPGLK